MNTYTSTETIRARKVTGSEELTVTEAGPRLVPVGFYITDDGRVFDGEEFESKFKARRASKPKAKAKPKPKPEPKTESKPTADPAERVAAARARKSS